MVAFKKFTKKGAMFGIDARVTLAVTAIAAFIVGINQFADSDRINKQIAKSDLLMIKSAIENYYEAEYDVPSNTTQLVNSGFLNMPSGALDPWGNSYIIKAVEQDKTINQSKMKVKYFYLISAGKNTVKDTSDVANVDSWLSLDAARDDIVVKFDTLKIEEKISKIELAQLNVIKVLLEQYIMEKQDQAKTYCDITGNQQSVYCDENEDSKYFDDEELFLNFMPKNIDDNNGKYYLTNNPVYNTESKFKSGYINKTLNHEYNMYSFINLIGGLEDYVISPRNLVLHFDSNKYNNNQSPYYSDVWYGPEQTSF